MKDQFYPYYERLALDREHGVEIDEDKFTSYTKHIETIAKLHHKLGSDSKLNSIKNLAKSYLFDFKFIEQLDQSQYLLPIEDNKVIDLESGKQRQRQRQDLFSFKLPIKWDCYKPEDETWVRNFILSMCNDDDKLYTFLQVWLGYGITGSLEEQKFLIIYGENGSSGKSCLQSLMKSCLGDFFTQMHKDVVLKAANKVSQAAQPYLVALRGKRQAWFSESGFNSEIDEEMIKTMTGGDPITARALHQNAITFMPTHKVTMITNHKPLASSNGALWRRIMLMENQRRYVDYRPNAEQYANGEREKDPKIKSICDKPSEGIKSAFLKFLIDGVLLWKQHGLEPYIPEVIKQSTSRYQQDQDLVFNFISECCEVLPEDPVNKTTWTKATEVLAKFKMYCTRNDRQCNHNPTSLGKKLSEKYYSDILKIVKKKASCYYYNLSINL